MHRFSENKGNKEHIGGVITKTHRISFTGGFFYVDQSFHVDILDSRYFTSNLYPDKICSFSNTEQCTISVTITNYHSLITTPESFSRAYLSPVFTHFLSYIDQLFTLIKSHSFITLFNEYSLNSLLVICYCLTNYLKI